MDINQNYSIREIHTDFEATIGNACKLIYPGVKIKFCIWHMQRALEIKKNSICKSDIMNDDELYILYKATRNLYLSDPNFTLMIFNIIKEKIILEKNI